MTDMPNKSLLVDPGTTEGQFQAGLSALWDVINEMAGQGDADNKTIIAGSIAPVKALVRVETENSDPTDDLTNVSATVIGSKLLIITLQESGRTLTLKHNAAGSDNLQLKDGLDVVLSDIYSSITFRYDSDNQEWIEVMRSISGDANIPAETAGGTADALTVTFTPPPVVLDKKLFLVRAAAANATSTPTLAINGGSAKTIVKQNNAALIPGDIPGAGFPMLVEYNSTLDKYVLLNPSKVAETDLSFSDVTTGNASTTAHGLLKKLPNDASQFLNGQGNYVVPPAANTQIFTASGTWTKPATGSMALIQMWGAGGGGGAAAGGGGGGGGAYIEILVPLSALSATETVTVGAGGNAGTPAQAGGNTSFGPYTIYGGAGGTTSVSGGGGGQSGAPSGTTGGAPMPDTAANGGSLLGGGSGAGAVAGGPSVYGGGSGSGNTNLAGGASVYGGGGGGGGSGTSTGGISQFGGNGGGTGQPGVAPGGGGGRNAAGARGEVRITVF